MGRPPEQLPPDREPSGPPTVLGPRLEELCFQVAGLWEAGCDGRLALPAHVDRLSVLGDVTADVSSNLVAVVRPATGLHGVFDCRVLDPSGKVVLRLDGYRTVPMPGELGDEVRGPLRAVMAGRG